MEPWLAEVFKSIGPIGLFAYAVVRLILDSKRINGNGANGAEKMRREIAEELKSCITKETGVLQEMAREQRNRNEELWRTHRIEHSPEDWQRLMERVRDIHRVVNRDDEDPPPRRRR